MATGKDLDNPNGPLIEAEFIPTYTEEQVKQTLGRTLRNLKYMTLHQKLIDALTKPRVIVLSDGAGSFDIFVKDGDFIWYKHWVSFIACVPPGTENVLSSWNTREMGEAGWKPFDTKSSEDEHAWRMSI